MKYLNLPLYGCYTFDDAHVSQKGQFPRCLKVYSHEPDQEGTVNSYSEDVMHLFKINKMYNLFAKMDGNLMSPIRTSSQAPTKYAETPCSKVLRKTGYMKNTSSESISLREYYNISAQLFPKAAPRKTKKCTIWCEILVCTVVSNWVTQYQSSQYWLQDGKQPWQKRMQST